MNRFHRWYCRSGHWRQTVSGLVPWALDGIDLGNRVLELGPGPGLTTDILRSYDAALTLLEVDATAAARLEDRLGASVDVRAGDATAMPFMPGSFSSVVAFTMFHHLHSPDLQDQLFCEVARVLRQGGAFAGSDSTASLLFRLAHLGDTMTVVDPHSLPSRLQRAGFGQIDVEVGRGAFRFRARRS